MTDVHPACRRHRSRSGWPLVVLLALPAVAAAEPGYYRDPALHGDTVVFTAEGDLWTVGTDGGAARRLTTHAGEEAHAAFSPDGRTIAFDAGYDGAVEAYVMPAAGGAPRRLSFEGNRVWVAGWTPAGEVLYASQSDPGPSGRRVLRAVDPQTLATRTLPLHDAHQAAIDPVSGALFFARFGLAVTGDHAKRYRGGALATLWRFDPPAAGTPAAGAPAAGTPAAEAVRLAPGVDAALHHPMWWQGRLYHLADDDGSDNLWSLDRDGGDRRQHTRHQGLDVRGPSLDGGRVVYQLGADLYLHDLATGADRRLAIELVSDFEQRRTRHLDDPLDYLEEVAFAPRGDALLLTARGGMAKVAPGPVRRVEIALPREHRGRAGVLSTDGKQVYAISDQSGENEIWRFAADGSAAAEQLTTDGGVHRWRLYPSPDGRYLAHDDKRGRLWVLDLETRANRQLDDGWRFGDDPYAAVVWSPDGKTLAVVRPDTALQRNQLLLLAVDGSRRAVLTSDRYVSFAPSFSPDGKWLWFLSNRSFTGVPGNPWGDRNLGSYFDRRARVYALALQPGLRFPFQPPDELAPEAEGAGETTGAGQAKPAAGRETSPRQAKTGKDSAAADAGKPPLPAVAWDGLADRLFEVPVPAANYLALASDADRLYLLSRAFGRDARPALETLALENDGPKPEQFAAAVREFALSADRKKLFYRTWAEQGPGEMLIVDAGAKAPSELAKATVRVGDWRLAVDPRAEWRQMFVDAWRMHRDFAFDRNLRGVDWRAVRARYEPLVERLTDRAELDDLLGQMASELGILHSQVRPGERRGDDEVAKAAGLGAAFSAVSGGLRIDRIWRTEPELPGERGPLARPGVDVRVGDVLQAVNGRPVTSASDLAVQLADQAGQQVLLDLSRGGVPQRAVVVPVDAGQETNLRYQDWVQGTHETVERVGQGRIGYLHLRAMTAGDLDGFVRDFYAQVDREGLIVDVRRNRGGNIDSLVIEKLLRRTWAFWQVEDQLPGRNMQQSFRGHLVVLIDQLTYSDGETFAAGVKALGLGPLVGMRTAGAGIWLSDRNRLADNGMARVAEYPQFASDDGRWLIEGRGVAPDVEVDNLPHSSYRGEDAQLARALEILAARLASETIESTVPQAIPPVGQPGNDVR